MMALSDILQRSIMQNQAARFVIPVEPPEETTGKSIKGLGRTSSRHSPTMAPTKAKQNAILGRVAAVAALGNLGKAHEGKWEDSNSKHFVARYGLFFQSYRGFNTGQGRNRERRMEEGKETRRDFV
jgi:hypothetical protein